jgi:hypothetical protein
VIEPLVETKAKGEAPLRRLKGGYGCLNQRRNAARRAVIALLGRADDVAPCSALSPTRWERCVAGETGWCSFQLSSSLTLEYAKIILMVAGGVWAARAATEWDAASDPHLRATGRWKLDNVLLVRTEIQPTSRSNGRCTSLACVHEPSWCRLPVMFCSATPEEEFGKRQTDDAAAKGVAISLAAIVVRLMKGRLVMPRAQVHSLVFRETCFVKGKGGVGRIFLSQPFE